MTVRNLYFEVIQPESKDKTLLRLLCRAEAEKAASSTAPPGKRWRASASCCVTTATPPPRYHAGLSKPSEAKIQEDFLYDRKTVMVATNAFRHGHRQVQRQLCHSLQLPKSTKPTIRRPGAPDGTGERTAFCCSTPGRADRPVPYQQRLRQRGNGRRAAGGSTAAGSGTAGRHDRLLQDEKLPAGLHSGLLRAKAPGDVAATAEAARGISSRWRLPGKPRSFSPA